MCTSTEYEDELSRFLYNSGLILDNCLSHPIFMSGFNPVQPDGYPGQFHWCGYYFKFRSVSNCTGLQPHCTGFVIISILVYTNVQPS